MYTSIPEISICGFTLTVVVKFSPPLNLICPRNSFWQRPRQRRPVQETSLKFRGGGLNLTTTVSDFWKLKHKNQWFSWYLTTLYRYGTFYLPYDYIIWVFNQTLSFEKRRKQIEISKTTCCYLRYICKVQGCGTWIMILMANAGITMVSSNMQL